MGILLSLPGFHITPTSNTTGTMFLSPAFDLDININKNPGAWGALRKRGGLRTEVKLRGGPVPDEAIEAADKLIKVYQAALLDRVLELESRAEKEGKEELEILRPPKRNNKIPFQHEESEALEILTAATQDQAGDIQEEQSSGADPEEESQPEIKIEEIQVQGNCIGGELLLRVEHNPPITYNPEDEPKIEYQNHEWENVEKEQDIQDKKEEILPAWNTWDEKDQALDNEIQKIRAKNRIDNLVSQACEIQRGAPEAPENEIFINRNSNGYSWRITARAASLDEALEKAIRANERLKESLNPKSE